MLVTTVVLTMHLTRPTARAGILDVDTPTIASPYLSAWRLDTVGADFAAMPNGTVDELSDDFTRWTRFRLGELGTGVLDGPAAAYSRTRSGIAATGTDAIYKTLAPFRLRIRPEASGTEPGCQGGLLRSLTLTFIKGSITSEVRRSPSSATRSGLQTNPPDSRH
jgi:hypothetical protein